MFNKYNSIYNFQLDAAATTENALCKSFFTLQDDALIKDWFPFKSIFLNPPYGRSIGKFIKKAYEESIKGCTVVCLVPARCDTLWWFNYAIKASEIIFITGRLKFINRSLPSYRLDGKFKLSSAPFPSCLIIFNGSNSTSLKISWKKSKDLL